MLRPLALLSLMALPFTAVAASAPGGMHYEARLREAATYDSNPLQLDTHAEAIFGSTTSPELVIRSKTPRSSFESDTRLDINLFDRPAYNSTDLHQAFALRRENAHWMAELAAGLDVDTTRTGELTNFANRLPRVGRTKYALAPALGYRTGARGKAMLRTGFTQVHYDHANFTDYNLYTLSPGYSYQLDPTHELTIGALAQRYASDSHADLTSDSYSPQIGLTTRVTPQLSTRIGGGVQSTDKHGSNAGSHRHGWYYIYEARADYETAADRLTISARRAREPFGNGTETLLTGLRFNERHTLTPTLALLADGQYQSADYRGEPGVNLDHRWTLGGGLAYALTPQTDLSAEYHYRAERLTHRDDAGAHLLMAGFTYHTDWK